MLGQSFNMPGYHPSGFQREGAGDYRGSGRARGGRVRRVRGRRKEDEAGGAGVMQREER